MYICKDVHVNLNYTTDLYESDLCTLDIYIHYYYTADIYITENTPRYRQKEAPRRG